VAEQERNSTATTTPVRLAEIRDEPLSTDEVLAAVHAPAAGGTVLFAGAVRDVDGGRAVTALGYSAHPSAEGKLREVAESVAARYPVVAVAVVHRVGELKIGDLAVVLAVSCPHRGEAFEAARTLIDELKETVPIWKHQIFDDGTEEWVGTP
jgi:molybdopterin synthase catalytic subunit